MAFHRPASVSEHRRTCLFSGNVQGVGFRYTVQNLAMQFDIRGYVRNTPDGRVELVMEGSDAQMNQLLDDINRKMGTYIDQVDCSTNNPTGEFDRFDIRH
jgi:acylphosphatase